MAKVSKFNRTDGDPVEAPAENVSRETSEEKKEIPKALYTITPPKFKTPEILSPEKEYEKVLADIENAKSNNQRTVIINHDLQDYAWQKLSQQGYKLKRRYLERTGDYDTSNIGELDPNKVEFEIDLTEFNKV